MSSNYSNLSMNNNSMVVGRGMGGNDYQYGYQNSRQPNPNGQYNNNYASNNGANLYNNNNYQNSNNGYQPNNFNKNGQRPQQLLSHPQKIVPESPPLELPTNWEEMVSTVANSCDR